MRVQCAVFVVLLGNMGMALSSDRDTQGSGAAPNHNTPLEMLASEDPRARQDAETQILKEHEKVVLGLAAIVSNHGYQKHKPDTVRRAIRLLGELRSAAAVPALVDNIGFPYLEYPKGTLDEGVLMAEGGRRKGGNPPAVSALRKIGIAAAPALVQRLKHPRHEIEFDACKTALFLISTPETADQISQIVKEIEEQRADESRNKTGETPGGK